MCIVRYASSLLLGLNFPSPGLVVCIYFQTNKKKQAELEPSESDKVETSGLGGLERLGPNLPAILHLHSPWK